jgi:hypothetical protein
LSLYVEPKKRNETALNVKVSHNTLVILNEYSDYTGYELGDLLNIISRKLMEDEAFVEYFKGKRSNKKIMTAYEEYIKNQIMDDEILL